MSKSKHMLKGIASAILPGLGQAFNKQFIKAVVFFGFFALLIGIELGTSRYFTDYDSYIKMEQDQNSGVGEMFTDSFAKNFYLLYQNQVFLDEIDPIEAFDEFYAIESLDADGFTIRDLVDFTANDIVAHSTPRYFLLVDDLIVSGTTGRTSDTGEIDEVNDLIIGEDDAAIAAKDFREVVTGMTVYVVGGHEYYTLTSETEDTLFINVDDPDDIIDEVDDDQSYYRTGTFYYHPATDKVYIECTSADSVLSSGVYRYTNITDSTDFIDATDEANDALVASLKKLKSKARRSSTPTV